MYICICHALTDGDLRSAVTEGAATHGEVFRHFGVKPCCGRCVPFMRNMLTSGAPAGERRHATDAVPPAHPVACHDKR